LAAAIIGNVFLQYPFGILADQWSRSGVIAFSAALTVLLSLALIWTIDTWLVWPVMIAVGSTAFAVYTVTLVLLGDHFQGPDLIAGSAAFGAMWGFGGLVGPPIAGIAVDTFGIDAVPVTLSLAYVVLLAGLLLRKGQLVVSVQDA
jgi:MFS family permease